MSKLIIIDEDTTMMMSFEEVLTKYKPLVKSQVNWFSNLKMEFDDKYQLATIGLWTAYNSFDVERGLGFGLLAKKAIQNNFKEALTYNGRAKRSGFRLVSIDNESAMDYDDNSSILDKLESDDNIEEAIVINSILKEFVSKLTAKQKEAIELYSISKSYKEVAEILGVGQTTISMRMTAAKRIFSECMEG